MHDMTAYAFSPNGPQFSTNAMALTLETRLSMRAVADARTIGSAWKLHDLNAEMMQLTRYLRNKQAEQGDTK